ncbi:hypothetical protein EON81_10825 [bacterium]|nr:MAG: hypothetical protein EON81_10825 [bacterium]
MSFNRHRGTTLVEVLVVIVVFLVGILAVVQIFPRGFQVLTLMRKGASANALARNESERLEASPGELPELIVPVGPGTDAEDLFVTSGDLGPYGDSLSAAGILSRNGVQLGHWALFTGANRYRGIVGETRRIPAPRRVGEDMALYGGLLYPNFGPIDSAYPLIVSGNDLSRNPRPPSTLEQRTDITDGSGLGLTYWSSYDTLGDGDFFLDNSDQANPAVYVPTGPSARLYRFTLSVVVSRNGRPVRRTYRNLPLVNGVPTPLTIPLTAPLVGSEQLGYPLVRIPLLSIMSNAVAAGDTLQSLYPESVRVKRGYRPVSGAFSQSDPYEYKMLSAGRGTLLFNPAGYSQTVDSSNGRQPLQATLDYTVADWRVLHEDFRLIATDNGQVKLAIGTIKGSTTEADGLEPTGLRLLEPINAGLETQIQLPGASYIQINDLETGGIVCERDPGNQAPLVNVNKSLGLIEFLDADGVANNGRQIKVLLNDGQLHNYNLQGRALRIYYMTRDEFAVQVLKPAATYSQTVGKPAAAEYYVGGSASGLGGVATRLYFPRADAGQKVTIGVLSYLDASNAPRQIIGQNFTISFRQNEENPSIDIQDVDPNATRFDPNTISARDVRGASLTVRTLWNPDFFNLGPDPVANLRKLDQWNRGTRKSTLQAYVSRGEANH